jgi:hypothetical protein
LTRPDSQALVFKIPKHLPAINRQNGSTVTIIQPIVKYHGYGTRRTSTNVLSTVIYLGDGEQRNTTTTTIVLFAGK